MPTVGNTVGMTTPCTFHCLMNLGRHVSMLTPDEKPWMPPLGSLLHHPPTLPKSRCERRSCAPQKYSTTWKTPRFCRGHDPKSAAQNDEFAFSTPAESSTSVRHLTTPNAAQTVPATTPQVTLTLNSEP